MKPIYNTLMGLTLFFLSMATACSPDFRGMPFPGSKGGYRSKHG